MLLKQAPVFILLLVLFQLSVIPAAAQPDSNLSLTEQEIRFLQEHPVIRVHNEMNWPPFNYNEGGRAKGFSIDYMNLVASKAGLDIEYMSGPTRGEFLQQLRKKELDVMLNIVKTPEREKYVLFTEPYVTNPNVIVSLKERPVSKLEELSGKRAAISKGCFYEELLKRDFPKIELLVVKNMDEVLKAVTFGRADAALGELAVVEFLIGKKMFTNLYISGEVDLGCPEIENFRIGIRDDWVPLQSIIRKAMNAISPTEIRKLKRYWLSMQQQEVRVPLSPEEQQYLREKGRIRMCIDPHWLPYEAIDEKGRHVGMSADFMELLSDRLGVDIILHPTVSWSNTLEAIKGRKCDIISMVNDTPDRRGYMDFTTPFVSFPYVIATTTEKLFIDDISTLLDETFCIVKGYSLITDLRRTCPGIKIIEVDTLEEGLQMVRERQVFGYIDAAATVGYQIQKNEMLDIKISGKLEGNSFDLSVATRNDEPLLVGIFQKGVSSFTKEEIQSIYNRWISVKIEPKVDYSLAWKILIASILALIAIFYWNRRLAVERNRTEEALVALNILKGELEEKNTELQRIATTDHLTGLSNRGRVEECLHWEVNRSDRFKHPFGMILFDIDRFKEVNDTYGHQVGDDVLIEIAGVVEGSIREIDICGRWGGEEFLIICPETDESGTLRLAENLRKVIENHSFPVVGKKTASFGVTAFRHGDGVDEMIRRADAALYQAKESGRNQVVLHR